MSTAVHPGQLALPDLDLLDLDVRRERIETKARITRDTNRARRLRRTRVRRVCRCEPAPSA